MPDIFIIAGCNGAGKTTAAYNLLPEVFKTVEFVNADEANDWYVYDNSGSKYELVAKSIGKEEKIINFDLFKIISGK